jgi:hypothetical protein
VISPDGRVEAVFTSAALWPRPGTDGFEFDSSGAPARPVVRRRGEFADDSYVVSETPDGWSFAAHATGARQPLVVRSVSHLSDEVTAHRETTLARGVRPTSGSGARPASSLERTAAMMSAMAAPGLRPSALLWAEVWPDGMAMDGWDRSPLSGRLTVATAPQASAPPASGFTH